MYLYLLKRISKDYKLYISIVFGVVLSLLFFFQTEFFLEQHISKSYTISFTPYTKWMGIFAISDFPFIYLFILPILVSLPFSSMYCSDMANQSINFILVRDLKQTYLKKMFVLNVASSFVISILPYCLNMYLSFMKLPNVKPTPLLNPEFMLSETNTLLPELYYNNPLLHMLMYIFLIGIYGISMGIFSIGMGQFIKNVYLVILSSFIPQLLLTVVFNTIGKPHYIAINNLYEGALGKISPISLFIQIIVNILIGGLLFWVGGKRSDHL